MEDTYFSLEQCERRQRIVRHIMQQVIAENPYKPDMEWGLFFKVQEIEDQNGLPEDISSYDIYHEYMRVFHYD